MFIAMLIVQLEWVQTWLAVAEVLLQAESDISLLGLLLLLLPELTCSCRNAFLQTLTASFCRDASLDAVAGDPSGPRLKRVWALSNLQGP